MENLRPGIPELPIPGGYLRQDPESEDIREIAQHVTLLLQKEHPDYRLQKIHEAATQVVAGLNYFLRLEYVTGQEKIVLDVISFKSLQRKISITQKQELLYLA